MIADKAKSGKDLLGLILIPAIVIMVGVAAFGLGRLSAPGSDHGFEVHPAPTT